MKPASCSTILLSVACLVIVGLSTLCWAFYKKSKRHYMSASLLALDPIHQSLFTKKSDGGIVFFGDSRISQWPAQHMSHGNTKNRGISGHTTTQCRLRFTEHVIKEKPQAIVLQLGINDLRSIPLFPHSKDAIIKNCEANLLWMVAQANKQKIPTVLLTIFPVSKVPLKYKLIWSKEVDEAVFQINQKLLSLNGAHLRVIDTAAILTGKNHKPDPDFYVDHLHLSEAGYAALKPSLEEALAKVIPQD